MEIISSMIYNDNDKNINININILFSKDEEINSVRKQILEEQF